MPQFWHLSPDHRLVAMPLLRKSAEDRFGQPKDYGEMLVGEQVRRYALPLYIPNIDDVGHRELGLIALMTAN